MKVLSTKILSPSQQSHLMLAGIELVQYSAISIFPKVFQVPQKITKAIVTSHNAAKQLMASKISANLWYCVGEKTKALLLKNNQKVVKMAQNASKLADFIVKTSKNEDFIFFCGNRKRDELPDILNRNNVSCKLIEIYQTRLNPQTITGSFDAVLFFSPSAVQSYFSKNTVGEIHAYCIGRTTANEVIKHSNNVIIAENPTVESVLIKLIKNQKHA